MDYCRIKLVFVLLALKLAAAAQNLNNLSYGELSGGDAYARS